MDSRHGPHHVAQNSTSSTLPFVSGVFPWWDTFSEGNGFPTQSSGAAVAEKATRKAQTMEQAGVCFIGGWGECQSALGARSDFVPRIFSCEERRQLGAEFYLFAPSFSVRSSR